MYTLRSSAAASTPMAVKDGGKKGGGAQVWTHAHTILVVCPASPYRGPIAQYWLQGRVCAPRAVLQVKKTVPKERYGEWREVDSMAAGWSRPGNPVAHLGKWRGVYLIVDAKDGDSWRSVFGRSRIGATTSTAATTVLPHRT